MVTYPCRSSVLTACGDYMLAGENCARQNSPLNDEAQARGRNSAQTPSCLGNSKKCDEESVHLQFVIASRECGDFLSDVYKIEPLLSLGDFQETESACGWYGSALLATKSREF
jgi:hypothetical protein